MLHDGRVAHEQNAVNGVVFIHRLTDEARALGRLLGPVATTLVPADRAPSTSSAHGRPGGTRPVRDGTGAPGPPQGAPRAPASTRDHRRRGPAAPRMVTRERRRRPPSSNEPSPAISRCSREAGSAWCSRGGAMPFGRANVSCSSPVEHPDHGRRGRPHASSPRRRRDVAAVVRSDWRRRPRRGPQAAARRQPCQRRPTDRDDP